MKRFVLDASVALSWFIDRPTAPYADQIRKLLLQGKSGVVPAIWSLEVANGFLISERRGATSPYETTEMLQELDVVLRSIEVTHGAPSVRRAVDSSRQANLTAYDAAYLDLAMEQRLSIATLDRRLSEAARRIGIPLAH
ncbi:MAG: type II toxin-antitoxin system VapC family toxin [Candidatus Sulfotelmatobacter sp.]